MKLALRTVYYFKTPQVFEKKSACGLFQEDTVVGEIVDHPKVPETQMPKERSACGSLQEDTVMPD